MNKKEQLFDSASLKQLCKKQGVQYKQLNEKHIRLIGGLAIDVWPKTGSCWILGTLKAWKPTKIEELFDVLNLKSFPAGVEWHRKKQQADYINMDHVCLICRKKMYSKPKTYTERLYGVEP